MKGSILLTFVLAVLLLAVQPVQADIPLIGSVSTNDGGIIATPSWYLGAGTTLSWNITDQGDYYTYSYQFVVPVLDDGEVKDLSHIIFEVSDTFTEANFLKSSDDMYDDLGTFSSTTSGNSNPGMPGLFEVGIKFDEGDIDSILGRTVQVYFITFDSDRIPTWGDFYAKGGNEGEDPVPTAVFALEVTKDIEKDYVTAWNSGFGGCGAKIVVPDTLPKVPVPGAILLGILGMSVSGIKLRKYM